MNDKEPDSAIENKTIEIINKQPGCLRAFEESVICFDPVKLGFTLVTQKGLKSIAVNNKLEEFKNIDKES